MAYEGGLGDAPGTLGLEVPQGSDDPGGQPDDDDEVEHAQEPQGDVGQGPDDGQGQDGAAEGELFVTNLLAEIANLTKRAIMAETMVAVLQAQAGKSSDHEDHR